MVRQVVDFPFLQASYDNSELYVPNTYQSLINPLSCMKKYLYCL